MAIIEIPSLLIECPAEDQRSAVGYIRMLMNITIGPMAVMQIGVRMDETKSIIRGGLLGRRRAKELRSPRLKVARLVGRFWGMRKIAFVLRSRYDFSQRRIGSKPSDGEHR